MGTDATTIHLDYLYPVLCKHLLREGGLNSIGTSASEVSPGCVWRGQVSFLLVMFPYFVCYNLQEDMFLNSISFPFIDSCFAGNTPGSPRRPDSAEGCVPMVPPQLPLAETEELQSSRRSITSSTYFLAGSWHLLKFCYLEGILV